MKVLVLVLKEQLLSCSVFAIVQKDSIYRREKPPNRNIRGVLISMGALVDDNGKLE
jgi:hypothetical protein